jgi:hypothetical protein
MPRSPMLSTGSLSDLILELYGPEIGQHARIAIGMATLPLNNAVTIATEVERVPLPDSAQGSSSLSPQKQEETRS